MQSIQRVNAQADQEQTTEVIEDVFSKMHSSVNEADLMKKCRNYSLKAVHFDAYRDENEKPFVFRSVQNAEQDIADQNMDKEYSSMEGIATFNTALQKFFFGENHPLVRSDRIVTFQTLSGIGALRVGLEFIKTNAPAEVYVSSPMGEKYEDIIKVAGLTYTEYPYLDPVSRKLDFDGMCKTLSAAKPGSVVLLSACAHNPTGIDPTLEQWKILAKLIKSKRLLPFFENFSQGLASGDLETDMKAVHIFIDAEVQLLMAQCFDKNMGLYGERVGALHLTCSNAQISEIVGSQLNLLVRRMYGLPPLHGARIVEKVLTNPQYTAEWKEDLKSIYDRITQMKALLYEELKNYDAQGDWKEIIEQTGMYWNTRLTAQQVEELVFEYNISFIQDGRINMSCINNKNVKHVAEAIRDVTMARLAKEEITIQL